MKESRMKCLPPRLSFLPHFSSSSQQGPEFGDGFFSPNNRTECSVAIGLSRTEVATGCVVRIRKAKMDPRGKIT